MKEIGMLPTNSEEKVKGLLTYQSNQTIRVKYKIVLCCLGITYQGMHTPYLHGSKSRWFNFYDNQFGVPTGTIERPKIINCKVT